MATPENVSFSMQGGLFVFFPPPPFKKCHMLRKFNSGREELGDEISRLCLRICLHGFYKTSHYNYVWKPSVEPWKFSSPCAPLNWGGTKATLIRNENYQTSCAILTIILNDSCCSFGDTCNPCGYMDFESVGPSFLHHDPIVLRAGSLLVAGAVLWIVGCLTASLASTH